MQDNDGNSSHRAANGSNQRRGKDHSRVEALLDRAKAGSNSALGRALNACRPGLLRIARRDVKKRLRHEVGASDVVQDTFANATRGFSRFRGRRVGQFVSWLHTILAHRLAEIARRTSHNGQRETISDGRLDRVLRCVPGEGYSPSSVVANQEYSDLIRSALSRMSRRDQQVLGLRFEGQLSFSQIGEQLELSEDAARMLFTRAVARLRRDLPPSGE